MMEDIDERCARFLEEALELVQAVGFSEHEAHKLVSYVYGRPKGELRNEAGGVGVSLLGLCEALGISADETEEVELLRIEAYTPEHFRLRQMDKANKGVGACPK